MDNIRFGSFVAQLRKERGLTQKELAQRLAKNPEDADDVLDLLMIVMDILL